MIRQQVIRDGLGAVDMRGNLLYPGDWVETYVLIQGTGAWMLIERRPL